MKPAETPIMVVMCASQRPPAGSGAGHQTPPGSPPTARAQPSRRAAADPRRLRILLAEDGDSSRWLLEQLLERQGHTVYAVADGCEVVRAMRNDAFDLVLMDVEMPRVDGYEATRRLRAAGVATPILAMTAHGSEDVRRRCLAAGMDGHLTKPLRADAFADAAAAVLAGASASAGRADAEPAPAPAPAFDRSAALERIGDEELLREIIDIFLGEAAELLSRTRIAADSGDAEAVVRATHTLRGSLATLSAGPALEDVTRAEQAARRGDLAEAEAALMKLERDMAELERALVEGRG